MFDTRACTSAETIVLKQNMVKLEKYNLNNPGLEYIKDQITAVKINALILKKPYSFWS